MPRIHATALVDPKAELAALKREVQRLSDLEACRRLRVTYFRCLDTANLADLKEILTEDFSCRCVGGDYVYEAKSRAARGVTAAAAAASASVNARAAKNASYHTIRCRFALLDTG